uniref:nicotinamidase n=1 Tax=Parastrongyloides trichosuri TaxID=131310 RepID=A0A0N4Z7C5_PARTI
MENIEKNCALIIVDVQNDFMNGSLCIKNGPAGEDPLEIVDPINLLITSNFFDCIIFTKDWHPPNHISFFENIHDSDRVLSECSSDPQCFDCVYFEKPINFRQRLFPKHCICNTEGASIYGDIIVPPDSVVINKGTNTFYDSYSGFFDNLKVHKTELENILKERGIKTVFVCGVAYEYCVACTAKDASDLGFKTFIITDCTKGLDKDDMLEAMEEMKSHGIVEINSKNILVIGCMITNIDEKPYDKNILILPEGRKSIRYRQQPKFIGKRNFKRTSDDNFFLQICKFLINWDVIKEESKRNTPLTWSLIFMITLLFILKCFTSQFRPLFNSQENEYIPPNNFTSPYNEVEIEKIKIIPSWYLSITSIDMVKTFALYYPLIKETNYVNEVLKYTRDREKNSQCCYDITNDIGYQTMVGVKCMGRENKRIIKNRHLYEGNICGIDPLYCHKNDKNDIILPLNVIDYPIDIICDYSKKSNIIHDETFIEIPYKPCTFGIHGRCELMSEDKCNWIGGYYHYEANLCSQVNGIEDLIFLGNDWHLFWLLNEKILAFLESYLSLFTRIVISLISVESFLSLLV